MNLETPVDTPDAKPAARPGPSNVEGPGEDIASVFDRKVQYHQKRKALLYEAARLFMEGGEGKFSLTEVARNLNITKPTLYYYFKSKQEILFECYSLSFDIGDRALDLAVATGGNALTILRAFVYHYTLAGLTELHPTMSLREMTLEPAYSKRILERRDRLHKRLRDLVARGFADGSIAECSPTIAIILIIGGVTELFKIYNPKGPYTAPQIAEQTANQLAGGLAARPV
jgi:TetR/AcrR family transcriptional regulator